jgi:L-ascorbate metabolism protein UlaG (beta-lactamase superfamily)
MSEITYIKNPSLKTILPGWEGNPVIRGRFIDPQNRFAGSFSKFLKWRFTGNDKRAEKKSERWRLNVIQGRNFLDTKKDCLVWLGHASFFLQLNGVRILIDPIFGKISGLVKRYSAMPCSPDDFSNIHYVLLSHAHRDHCDFPSLNQVYANNKFTLLTSLNTGKLVASVLEGLNYQEAGWYQQYKLRKGDLQITFLPTRHWSNRYTWDINETLWGSFMIQSGGLTIYFGGDSGYSNYPKQAGELFKNIDISIFGVGAYYPFFMMREVHTGPHDALKAFHELGAKTFVPMHYGTYDLADEPLGEPYRILKQLEKEKQINGELRMPDVGEIMYL